MALVASGFVLWVLPAHWTDLAASRTELYVLAVLWLGNNFVFAHYLVCLVRAVRFEIAWQHAQKERDHG